jgi:hypothetical protein
LESVLPGDVPGVLMSTAMAWDSTTCCSSANARICVLLSQAPLVMSAGGDATTTAPVVPVMAAIAVSVDPILKNAASSTKIGSRLANELGRSLLNSLATLRTNPNAYAEQEFSFISNLELLSCVSPPGVTDYS